MPPAGGGGGGSATAAAVAGHPSSDSEAGFTAFPQNGDSGSGGGSVDGGAVGATPTYGATCDRPSGADGGADAGESAPGVAAAAGRLVRAHALMVVGLAAYAGGLALLGTLVFEPLPWQAWFSFAILGVMFAALVVAALPTQVVLLLALVTLLAFQVVSPKDALSGFAGNGVGTIAVLFVVVEGITRTSTLAPAVGVLLGKPRSLLVAQARVMGVVAAVSAFLYDTPTILMLLPLVESWAGRAGVDRALLLMPLNNAGLLGGAMTLLGTSANLVVVDLAKAATDLVDDSGAPLKFRVFDVGKVGAPVAVAGLVYMLIASRFLLGRRRGQADMCADVGGGAIDGDKKSGAAVAALGAVRAYTCALRVQPRAAIIDDTVVGAGLRRLRGLFLIEIERENGEVLPAVDPETRLAAGDTLIFSGDVDTVRELYHLPGLEPATTHSRKIGTVHHLRRLVEVVISHHSTLVGRGVRELGFRSVFRAAIIAVHRRGEYVDGRTGDVVLAAGDCLLLETDSGFAERHRNDARFGAVLEVRRSQPVRRDVGHQLIAGVIVVAMVGVAASGVVPLFTAAAVAAVVMLATGCLSLENASTCFNLPVLITVAASVGLSTSLETTGAVAALAAAILDLFSRLGELGILYGIAASTVIVSSMVTNVAAVSLLFPIVQSLIVRGGVSAYAAIYVLMVGGSLSFATPIAYNTNGADAAAPGVAVRLDATALAADVSDAVTPTSDALEYSWMDDTCDLAWDLLCGQFDVAPPDVSGVPPAADDGWRGWDAFPTALDDASFAASAPLFNDDGCVQQACTAAPVRSPACLA